MHSKVRQCGFGATISLLALTLCLLGARNSLAQSSITVAISPVVNGLTVGQSVSLVATVTGDSQNKGVTWSATGGSFTAVSSTSATYMATAAGVYTVTATSMSDPTKSASVTFGVTDLTGVFTYHNNLSRDGTNPSEYTLTPANVSSATFGKLFSCTVDGAIYAQPLWVANVTIGGTQHNVVLVATQHDSLYAFDADANDIPCKPLWHVSLIDANHGGSSAETTVPSGPTGNLVGKGFGDITPEVGVTGTPVIDPSSNPITLYVVSKSVIASGPTFYQRLHAIDITTGNEQPGSPVPIEATFPGTAEGGATVTFSAQQENQRPGLALVNGVVYIAWAAHEDKTPYYGWVIGYDAKTLAQKAVFNAAPDKGLAGIWMSGGAPSADANNNLYMTTGNGPFDATSTTAPNNDYGDTVLKLTGGLSLSQYFTPSNWLNDETSDSDFGAGGAVLVDQTSGPVQHLLIGGGKDGYLYLLNRDALGGLGDTNAVQRFYFGSPIFGTGAFWNNTFYLAAKNGHLQAFSLDTTTGKLNTANVSQSGAVFGFPGSTPSVSSLGDTNGIVWALNNANYCTKQSPGCGPAVLHAYDAGSLTAELTELWNSTMGTGNAAGNAVKFAVPTVANGKVYVGTRGNNTGGATTSTSVPGEVDVYGLLGGPTPTATPTFSPGAGTYAVAQSVKIIDTTAGAVIYYTTNGNTPTPSSPQYTGAISVPATTTIQAIAIAPGMVQSAIASATYTITPLGPAPILTSASPNTGMQGQSNLSVVLTGSNFLSGPTCSFGAGITVNSCTFNSTTQITANISIATNATVGTNTITITDTDGQVATLTNGFTITVNTSPFQTIRVNSGGPSYTDSQGQLWSADEDFTGGKTSTTTKTISNTRDPALYQKERYGDFTYQFAVPNGSYTVVLKFAEYYWSKAGQRIFNVAINGTPVLSDFDIIAAAGGPEIAIDKTFSTVTSSGTITIQFTSGPADLPKISAIEIAAASGVSVQVAPATVNLYAAQQQQFTATVAGNSNTAVTWTYSPQVGTLTAGGLYTAPASITTAQTISVTATSQADSTKSATAQITLLPPQGTFSPIFVHSGGAAYTDSVGNNWSADEDFAGGKTSSTTSNILNTPDPTLYQTERYGASTYQFAVPTGSYTVVLKFAEYYWTKVGQRIFNVSINGTQVLTNFDIIAAAGAPLTAIDKSFPVTVTGNSITIQFITGTADLPKISAIEIRAASSVNVQINPASASLAGSQSQQFGATVTGTTNTGVTWTYSPQVGTLVTSGATAGLYTAPATVSTAQTVWVTATSTAAPTQSSTATVTVVPPFSPIFLHSGGAAYTDSLGNNWSADADFSGGQTSSTTSNILNTPDPKLYQTERYGTFTYQFSVPNGNYTVVLKFAEYYWTKAGQRIFNVSINGTQVLTNFDIIAAAGAPLTAIDKSFPVTVTNQQITIQFMPGSANFPKVSAIEIH